MSHNRLLTDVDRELYKELIKGMFGICPGMMGRKIPRANVQQAFTLDLVLKSIENTQTSILCVGSFEDTSNESLKKSNIPTTEVDPYINTDLHTFVKENKSLFDIVFSTSVIEHVKDDDEFLKDICSVLKPAGICILTCDFNNSYKPGDKLPYSDVRFYTKKDFTRFKKILKENNCSLIDKPNWEGEPEFTHDGCDYSFATFVFRKNF